MIQYDLVWWGHLQTRVRRHSWGTRWRATRSHRQSHPRLCKSKRRWALSQSCTAGDHGDGDRGEFTFMKVMVMVMRNVMMKVLIRLKMMEVLMTMTLPCQWRRCHDGQHKETRHSRQRWFSQLRHLNLFRIKLYPFPVSKVDKLLLRKWKSLMLTTVLDGNVPCQYNRQKAEGHKDTKHFLENFI